MPQVSKKDAGYIKYPGRYIHCGTCGYFNFKHNSNGKKLRYGTCPVVEGRIDAWGCCNSWDIEGNASFDWASGRAMENALKGLKHLFKEGEET